MNIAFVRWLPLSYNTGYYVRLLLALLNGQPSHPSGLATRRPRLVLISGSHLVFESCPATLVVRHVCMGGGVLLQRTDDPYTNSISLQMIGCRQL